jgi:coproporphyrinogen III oxidase-like Fe-S oxidoreductase
VECNPDSVHRRFAADLFALGVTRFSLGVQSFDDGRLGALGRIHDAAQVRHAIDILQERGAACSVDLICGGLGQTRAQWCRDVEVAVASGVGHVSVYPLTVDEETPLSRRVLAGTVDAPDDDEQADMMLDARDILEGAGLMRYEVASYARLGEESRHNSSYWTGVPYLGLGVGAASMMPLGLYRHVETLGLWHPVAGGPCKDDIAPDAERSATRCARVRLSPASLEMHEAISSYGAGRPMDVQVESLDAREVACEDLMLGMRLVHGVDGVTVDAARSIVPDLAEVLASLVRDGLITATPDGGYRPTDRGWLLGNELYGRLWGLAR